jgi:hypothetical protein
MDRDENQENILEDIIRGSEDVADVTEQFLNDSGEGDASLNRPDSSGEVGADAWGEGELGRSDERKADEVHIYILIN